MNDSTDAPLSAPAPPNVELAADAETERDERAADRRVLIIEDDATFAQVLSVVARAEGFAPVVATRGDVGHAMVRQLGPRVVVLDVRLPGLDGWTLLDRLKHDPATRHTPVIVVTGDERRARALALGAFAFLRKPCSRESLVAALLAGEALAAPRTRRLLLVEGAADEREATREVLAGERVEVTAVGGAADALGALEATRYDALAVVPPLADASVTELLDGLARVPAARALPVLLCLGEDVPTAQLAALQARIVEAPVRVARTRDGLLAEAVGAFHVREADLGVAQRAAMERARRRDPALAGRRVLLVDDDPRNRFALGNLLELEGLRYTTAASGRECLELLARGEPVDLVLMDVMMPEMDGCQAMRAIRALPAFAELPVIAVTARAMKGDRDRCLEAGATDFLAKPVDTEQLLAVLRLHLTG
jgi:CheY-like chemotaxis protein